MTKSFWLPIHKGERGYSKYVYRCHNCGNGWENNNPPRECPNCGSRNEKAYYCDPQMNTECMKTGCYIFGGICKLTTKIECARHPQEVIKYEQTIHNDGL